jgi:hypothetical protein
VRPAGAGWTLIDLNGHPVATLRPAKIAAFPPAVDLQAIRLIGHVPPLPASERAALDRVITVPADATTARASEVIGTWHPAVPSRAFMTFRADGSYAASDGWHCSAGRWAVDPVGQLAFAPGLATRDACPRPEEDLVNLPQWFADANVLGTDPTHLLLFDDTGRLLRTVQENAPATPSS